MRYSAPGLTAAAHEGITHTSGMIQDRGIKEDDMGTTTEYTKDGRTTVAPVSTSSSTYTLLATVTYPGTSVKRYKVFKGASDAISWAISKGIATHAGDGWKVTKQIGEGSEDTVAEYLGELPASGTWYLKEETVAEVNTNWQTQNVVVRFYAKSGDGNDALIRAETAAAGAKGIFYDYWKHPSEVFEDI